MGWDTTTRNATWDSNISWDGQTWVASGIAVRRLTSDGGTLEFPNGTTDPWLSLVLNEGPRDRAITIYKYYFDFLASPQVDDAELVFTGFMDQATITPEKISMRLIERAQYQAFPFTSIDRPTYTHLLQAGRPHTGRQ